jgi:hypothetical protein
MEIVKRNKIMGIPSVHETMETSETTSNEKLDAVSESMSLVPMQTGNR